MLANSDELTGVSGRSDAEIYAEVRNGAKFVRYIYCVSIGIMTFKRSSKIHFVPAGKSAVVPGLGWSLLTFLLGWWGIPWGPIYSVQSIFMNFAGGYDVTEAVMYYCSPSAAPEPMLQTA